VANAEQIPILQAPLPGSYVETAGGSADLKSDPINAFGVLGSRVEVDYELFGRRVPLNNTFVLSALALTVQQIADVRGVKYSTAHTELPQARAFFGVGYAVDALAAAFKSRYFTRIHAIPPYAVPLTDRELDIAYGMVQGLDTRAISRRLHYGQSTLKADRVSISEKGFATMTSIALFMTLSGLAECMDIESKGLARGAT
jgi:hypothetical protein